jgi:hypothetical protein
MKNYIKSFAAGVVITFFIIAGLVERDDGIHDRYYKAKMLCQQSLPRDQSCTVEMVGVVVSKQ